MNPCREGAKATADDFTGGAKEVGGEMAGFFTTPVAGGILVKVLYLITMLAAVVSFVAAVADVAGTWGLPITSIEMVQELELEMPDIFVCYPATFVESINNEEIKEAYYGVYDIKGKECMGMASAKTLGEAGNPSGCFLETMKASSDMELKYRDPNSEPAVVKTAKVKKGERAAKLAASLPAKGEHKAFCFEYAMDGKKVQHDDKSLQYFFWDLVVDFAKGNAGAEQTHAFLYFTAPGGEPDAAAGHFFPALGMITQAEISLTMVRDQTKLTYEEAGMQVEAEYQPRYSITTTSLPDSMAHSYYDGRNNAHDNSFTMVGIFKFSSFVVNYVVIRTKTPGEIWTDIGALWGGAALIMTLFFTSSGFVRSKDQKELMVFRFQSAKSKKAALAATKGGAVVKETETEMLMRRMDALEAQLGGGSKV